MSESSILHAVIDALLWHKCYVLRVNSGTMQNASTGSWVCLAPKGTPDILCGLNIDGYKVLGFVECKGSGKLSTEQIAFLRLRHSEHYPWLVCDDPKQVDEWIKNPMTYHGDPEHTRFVLDESSKFVPAYDGRHHRKTEKMSFDTMYQFDGWSKKTGLQ